jgi:hypothetical protein
MEYTVEYNCHRNNVLILPTTLKQLKLFYDEEVFGDGVHSSLRQLSKLTKLSLYGKGNYCSLPDGRKWEEFIQSSLPLLTTLQFCFPFYYYNQKSDTLNEVMASFSTPFYLVEKRWFIRCQSNENYSLRGILYSLPFAFAEMTINTLSFDTSISTLFGSDINETKITSYAKVKTLKFNLECQEPSQDFATSSIVKLVLKTRVPTKWFPLLTNVRSLDFTYGIQITSTEFVPLLLNTPQLRSLKLTIVNLIKLTDRFTNNVVCDHLSQQIQSLVISEYFTNGQELGVVTVRQLSILVRIFGKNVQHFSLAVSAHSNSVLPILRRMRQFRSLHIRFSAWSRTSRDTATCWLQQPLPGITMSDFVQVTHDNDFYVWFGNAL